PYIRYVTVSADAGEIIDKDIDPSLPGLQVGCNRGEAVCRLLSPSQAEQACITVLCDGITGKAGIFFKPHLRDTLLTGLVDIRTGAVRQSNPNLYEGDGWFTGNFLSGARGAVFVKGELLPGTLITASYDTGKQAEEELFRRSGVDPEAADIYPIYGDESRFGYETLSRSKLYLKMERNRSYLLYGDYYTNFKDTRLGAYNRALNGCKTEIDSGDFKATAFTSYTDREQIVDSLPGKGISGYYYLSRPPVVEGSEIIRLETRDRMQPDRVISRKRMVYGRDYIIDYPLGALLFKAPVPARDADLNPVYIIAFYETCADGSRHAVYGAHGSLKAGRDVRLGLTSLGEDKVFDYRLLGLDMCVGLPAGMTLRTEWARTRDTFDIDGDLSGRSGSGLSLDLTGKVDGRLKLSACYRDIDDYFSNPSAVDVFRGTQKTEAGIDYRLDSVNLLKARYFNDIDTLNDMYHRYAAIGLERKFPRSAWCLDLLQESADDRFIPYTEPGSRSPFDIYDETPGTSTAVRLAVETALSPRRLSLTVQHRQDIGHGRDNSSIAGLNYLLNETGKLYLRQARARFDERSEDRTVFGTESRVYGNMTAFSEYRLESGMDGSRAQQSIGLRNKIALARHVTGNFTLENLSTVRGSERETEPDALAVTGGIEYLPRDDFKVTSRLEYRNGSREFVRFGELGLLYKAGRDYSLILKERYSDEMLRQTGSRVISRLSLGLAYRPVEYDRFNGLARLEMRHKEDSTTELGEDSTDLIFSCEGIYRLNERTELTGKYAGKSAHDGEEHCFTDLIAAGIIYDLGGRLDLEAEYRLATCHAVDSSSKGGSVELGYCLMKDLWLSAGYCFDRFDADLTGEDYSGRGPYLKLRLKFDEGILPGGRMSKG
ncbi:MAG: hypothetical protein PHT33_15290, partial [bacterium]|nr:hypothetical protein [bacterium]